MSAPVSFAMMALTMELTVRERQNHLVVLRGLQDKGKRTPFDIDQCEARIPIYAEIARHLRAQADRESAAAQSPERKSA